MNADRGTGNSANPSITTQTSVPRIHRMPAEARKSPQKAFLLRVIMNFLARHAYGDVRATRQYFFVDFQAHAGASAARAKAASMSRPSPSA
ncbi:MAG: hypothetical protein ACYCS8_01675 [Acidithiobacillus sp.]